MHGMNNRFLYWITFVSVNSGLLFGLNMAGISGAIPFLKDFYVLNDIALGLAVSSIIIGCLFGSLFAGSLSDKYGRRRMMVITAVLFIVSAIGCSLTSSFWIFVISRIVCGLAVGSAAVLSPTYISEISPAEKRGTLVTYNQLAIVIGILLAYFIDYALVGFDNGWRYMLAVPIFFGLLFLIFLHISFPESPRWLIKVGQSDKAKGILEKLGGTAYAEAALKAIRSTATEKSDSGVHIKELFKGRIGYVVLLGTLLAAFQQITGINAVVNYAPAIFQKTGVGTDTALLQSIIVGFVNFLFTIVAVRLVDSSGRKTLLTWGAAGMTISLVYLSIAFNASGLGVLISLLAYIAFFAASLAPVMWVVTSEIYPTRIRGVAMSFSTAVSWIFTLIVVQFFPWMLSNLGGAVSFGLFAFFSLAALIFIIFFIPETKGKSLEQIQKDLKLS
jgi:sugar porter (SP) family MFS transporter